MHSIKLEEILPHLDQPRELSNFLKEKSNFEISDSIYEYIVHHYQSKPLSIENLMVQRNLYGRLRSTSLLSTEIDCCLLIVRQCLESNCHQTGTLLLQYLHNINRVLPKSLNNLPYLCSVILRNQADISVLACIFCAYFDENPLDQIRFDLIINALYGYRWKEDYTSNSWVLQLSKKLIDSDTLWLRKFHLERLFSQDLLNSIDKHETDQIFKCDSYFIRDRLIPLQSVNLNQIDFTMVQSLSHLQSRLIEFIDVNTSYEIVSENSLFHLLTCAGQTTYPDNLHCLFICSSRAIYDRENYSIDTLQLFRYLVNLINNYYTYQQDLFDDEQYRLIIASIVSHLLIEVHRRRSQLEHPWYYLYLTIPEDHPLPTFDMFGDLLRLLAGICYKNRTCQDQVRITRGTIESILSMTQIDINQPKSQACATWLIKCLTEMNEENQEYIKQIR